MRITRNRQESSSRSWKGYSWLLLLLAVGAGVGYWFWTRNQASATASPPLTMAEPVRLGRFSREVIGTGIVEAAQERNLNFASNGIVAEVLVREGDSIEAGALLARQESSALQRDLTSRQASLNAQRASLNQSVAQQEQERLSRQAALSAAENAVIQAQQNLQEAQRMLEMNQRLLLSGAASRLEVENNQESLTRAEQALRQAQGDVETRRAERNSLLPVNEATRSNHQATIAATEADIARLEQQIAETELRAPFAGVVGRVNMLVGFPSGALGTPGNGQAGSSSEGIRLVDVSSLLVSARFDETRTLDLRVNAPALISPDANPQLRLPARVSRISPVAERSGNLAQLVVSLELADDPAVQDAIETSSLRAGYTVTVRVDVAQLEDEVLLVPLEAISEAGGEAWVFRIANQGEGRGRAERVLIDILDRNPTVAALSTGALREGDSVAVLGVDNLSDSAEVRLSSGRPGGFGRP